MARAREVEGLDGDEPFGLAAARVLEVRSDEVIERSARVLETDDIEGVHDMRVATRRLQTALEVFAPCFPRKRQRNALKRVKALARVLGERRDPDVSIEVLEPIAAAMGASERRGAAVLVERFRREQEDANRRLAPFVEPQELQRLRADLGRLARSARERAADAGGGG